MPDERLPLTRDGAVAILTFNRPEALNAFGGDMLQKSAEIAREVAEDESIRCFVVTGAGRAFSAGGDVKGMASRGAAGAPPPPAVDPSFPPTEISRLLYEMPKPTIAAVRGPAAGGGMSIALSADIRIAGESARFVPAFGRIATSVDFGGTWLLQRLIGPAKAKERYFSGQPILAPEALELGIVSRVVPDDQLMDEVMALARELAAGPTFAFGLMKDNFRFGATHTFQETLAHELENFRTCTTTADHREAARAFVEKRPPQFAGR